MRSITLDGCKGLERFELNGTFPRLERLSLRNCDRLAVIVVVAAAKTGRIYSSLTELLVSNCPALRAVAPGAQLRGLEKLVASGCTSLVELPSASAAAEEGGASPSTSSLAEVNFFGCRSLPTSALEKFLGTATGGDFSYNNSNNSQKENQQPLLPPSSRLRSLSVNGCVSLSRLRVSSGALEVLDASGCRSCCEVDLRGCSPSRLRSLRLDGCRELTRLALPVEHASYGGGGGDERAVACFLDPESTSAAGVTEEVAALVSAATKAKKKKKKNKKKEGEKS